MTFYVFVYVGGVTVYVVGGCVELHLWCLVLYGVRILVVIMWCSCLCCLCWWRPVWVDWPWASIGRHLFACCLFCLVNRGHYKPNKALSWPDARRLTLLHAYIIFGLWMCGILIRGLSLHILALFWLARGDSVSIHVDRQAPHMGCRVFRWVWVIPWHVGAYYLEPCWGMEIFEFSLEHACDRVVGN